jgi:thiol-disulfide isomerase/thioredoxin
MDLLQVKETIVTRNQDIPVVDFNGLEGLLAQDDGKVYIINFWATWCKPCVEEMPHLLRLAKEMGDRDARIILVSLDFRSAAEETLDPFLENHGVRLPVVLLNDPDANTWISKVDPSWGGSIPATLIYKGSDRVFYEKALSYSELIKAVQKLNSNH